jgi:hypothetical protein
MTDDDLDALIAGACIGIIAAILVAMVGGAL